MVTRKKKAPKKKEPKKWVRPPLPVFDWIFLTREEYLTLKTDEAEQFLRTKLRSGNGPSVALNTRYEKALDSCDHRNRYCLRADRSTREVLVLFFLKESEDAPGGILCQRPPKPIRFRL